MSDIRLTYGSYLKVPELLSLQTRVSAPPHHDEMLFIVVHQVHELWFKQMLHELDAAKASLAGDRPLTVLKILKRVHAIQRVLTTQIDVLETMTPEEFNAFRALLKPASGFQSTQFREVEFLCGGGDPRVLAHMQADPGLEAVERRRTEGTLFEALLGLLARRGYDVPAKLLETGGTRVPRESDPVLVESLRRLYTASAAGEGPYDLYLLCEAFVEFDELMLLWRTRHVRMVERTIGLKQGTGGSEGAAYLHRTLQTKFFPELWDVRTVLR
jgi:tryptophan 2,3-dioxygenase